MVISLDVRKKELGSEHREMHVHQAELVVKQGYIYLFVGDV